MESVNLRKFNENDIEKKIKWINDPKNNEFLHYNIPLNYENTLNWYIKNQNNPKRKDMIIEYNGIAVGVIGIINIDKKNTYVPNGMCENWQTECENYDNIILHLEKTNIREKEFREKQQI